MPTSESLDLAKLDDAGFNVLWRDKIEPIFARYEAPRLTAKEKYKQRLTWGLPASAALGIGLGVIFQDVVLAVIVAALSAIVAYAFALYPLGEVGQQVKSKLLNALAAAIGATYHAKMRPDGVMERTRSLGLTPSADRSSFDDWFHGTRHSCPFDLFEAHLENEHRDKDGDTDWVTVFRGQIIRLTFPKKFLATTVVRRDAGIFNGLMGLGKVDGAKLERVGVADPTFERTFEIWSTDQVEARYLVHPVLMQRLLDMETMFHGKRLRCGFQDGEMVIAIEGGDKFEVGDMTKSLTDPTMARSIVGQLRQIMLLIDDVLTAEEAVLKAHQARQT
jgi:hypothetical protein